ncbi:hypothetical protein PQX77_012811 [Marasmius sp. AFHP31]|nr:hypothetical protein PQX77_012811 [Marasmius sp. AFHP31]
MRGLFINGSNSPQQSNTNHAPTPPHSPSPPSQSQDPGPSDAVSLKRQASRSQPRRGHDSRRRQPQPERTPKEDLVTNTTDRFSGDSDTRDGNHEECSSVKETASSPRETNREAELLTKLEAMERKNQSLSVARDYEASRAVALQEKLANAQKACRQTEERAKAQVGDMRNQLAQSNSQHARTRKAYDDMKSIAEWDRREVERKRRECSSLQSQWNGLATEHENLIKRSQALESDHGRLKAQFDSQSGELHQLKDKYKAQQLILDHRTKELQEAQAYLTSTRSTSGADIIRLIESLNAEILQVASSITDTLPFEQYTSARTTSKRMVMTEYLGGIFGEEAIAAATCHPSEDDLDIIVQNALQYLMVGHCKDLVERWHVDPIVSNFLKEMYRRIRKNNSSSVAGRWRTMTKAEVKYGRYDQVENNAKTRIIDDIQSLVHRWMKFSDKRAQASMSKIIETKVDTVLNIATQIDRAMGIDVVSEDWEAYLVHPGKPFNTVWMEDVFQASQGSTSTEEEAAGIVLCSTALGLRRRGESGPDNEDGEWQVMAKAKVLLDRAFEKW